MDGSIEEFEEPITVAEIMLEHPQQVVVEFHSAVNHKRPTPLPADNKLEMKKTYVMVPVKPGKAVGLSSEDCRRVLLMVNSSLQDSNYLMCSSGFLPWVVRLFKRRNQNIASLQIKEDINVVEINKEEGFDFSEFLIEERGEYMSRQLSGKGWKPNLDTIKEKKVKRRILSRWLFLKGFGFTAMQI